VRWFVRWFDVGGLIGDLWDDLISGLIDGLIGGLWDDLISGLIDGLIGGLWNDLKGSCDVAYWVC